MHALSRYARRPSRPRASAAVVLSAVLLALGSVGYTVPGCYDHDRQLRALRRDFARLRHPPGTRLIGSKAVVGLLSGNGNHCDYFVGDLRTSAGLTRDALRHWYASHEAGHEVFVIPFRPGSGGRDEARPYALPEGPDNLGGWFALPSSLNGDAGYVVYYHESDDPGHDIRCH